MLQSPGQCWRAAVTRAQAVCCNDDTFFLPKVKGSDLIPKITARWNSSFFCTGLAGPY